MSKEGEVVYFPRHLIFHKATLILMAHIFIKCGCLVQGLLRFLSTFIFFFRE